MTVKDLKDWLATLPSEADAARITSCVHGHPFGAKRVVIRRFKDGSGAVLCVNSAGTHLTDEFYAESEAIAESLTNAPVEIKRVEQPGTGEA